MASKSAADRLNSVLNHVNVKKDQKVDDIFSMKGNIVMVTGGSRGLGLEMVKAFMEKGAEGIVIASRKGEECEKVAMELNKLSQGKTKCVGMALHVGDWKACDRVFAQVIKDFGRLDVLVNNAGISPLYPGLDQVSEELYNKVFDVNLKGPFRLSVLAAEHMCLTGKGGSIINVSSIASTRPTGKELPYGMAKAGLNNLTLGLARTYGPLVRVNCIIAGPFLTDISKAWDMEWFNNYAKSQLPLARAGNPQEFIGAALYFASDASSFTTGALLEVHGGPNK